MVQTFIETIRVLDGQFYNLSYHRERMRVTSVSVLGRPVAWTEDEMIVPEMHRRGVVKCRVVYDTVIREISFESYVFRQIESLKLVDGTGVDYRFKSTNRTALSRLVEQKRTCDEVLIVQEGMITDTSFSNVVFEDATGLYTPTTFLLNGTRRQRLLHDGIICERAISVEAISRYDRVYLVNAMMGLEDGIVLPTKAVHKPDKLLP